MYNRTDSYVCEPDKTGVGCTYIIVSAISIHDVALVQAFIPHYGDISRTALHDTKYWYIVHVLLSVSRSDAVLSYTCYIQTGM